MTYLSAKCIDIDFGHICFILCTRMITLALQGWSGRDEAGGGVDRGNDPRPGGGHRGTPAARQAAHAAAAAAAAQAAQATTAQGNDIVDNPLTQSYLLANVCGAWYPSTQCREASEVFFFLVLSSLYNLGDL